jgi:hypothetical protein
VYCARTRRTYALPERVGKQESPEKRVEAEEAKETAVSLEWPGNFVKRLCTRTSGVSTEAGVRSRWCSRAEGGGRGEGEETPLSHRYRQSNYEHVRNRRESRRSGRPAATHRSSLPFLSPPPPHRTLTLLKELTTLPLPRTTSLQRSAADHQVCRHEQRGTPFIPAVFVELSPFLLSSRADLNFPPPFAW